MKVELITGKKVEAKYLAFYVKPLWHGYISVTSDSLSEDGSDLPCLCNNIWCPIIDLDEGRIINWQEGCFADILIERVESSYASLMDCEKKVLARSENETLYCGNMSKMDDPYYYFAFRWSISGNGKIINWKNLKKTLPSEDWEEIYENYEEYTLDK